MKAVIRIVVVVAIFSSGLAFAQYKVADKVVKAVTPVTAPTLADVDKLKIDNIAKRIEIAQLRAQAAQAEFDRARAEIAQLLQSLHRDGFDLDLQTMTYVPKKDDSKK